ncbi:hypothetical protein B0H11DRAFT_2239542 [Mycena galericulata]|nr:hypothetical protein B0H11DRAFT_2239542 [Mycena galericulata]
MSNDPYTTLSQLLDTTQPWDLYDDTSNLISPRKFSKFILVPHLAACLITEDLEITLNDAVEVLENSNEYSRLFNGDLPEKVDIVVAANPESSQPPRHRKPAFNLKLPAPKAITLENFPPPGAREKKSAKSRLTPVFPPVSRRDSRPGRSLSVDQTHSRSRPNIDAQVPVLE